MIYRRVHFALQSLLQLIPTATNVLSSQLRNSFPNTWDTENVHSRYIHNILKIIQYAPELRAEILALITERVVDIDVQVQVDIEDLDDIEDTLVQDISKRTGFVEDAMDDEDDDESDDESESGDETDSDAEKAKMVRKNVLKLDLIMDILFNYYDPIFTKSTPGAKESTFNLLLSHFKNIILPTYRSRHTQFLLFHYAQTSPALIDLFVNSCIQVAFEKGRQPTVRQAAAAYLASFIARGSQVSSTTVQEVFAYLGQQVNAFHKEHEPTCRGPDLRRYSVYYSQVQALLYIFCFRWRDLETPPSEPGSPYISLSSADSNRHTFVAGVKETLSTNVFSTKLNPLKVCSPVIVNEFVHVAHKLDVLYAFHIVDANKRTRLGNGIAHSLLGLPERGTALSGRGDESMWQLDGYFPFDPYHLPRSRRWVAADYREWEPLPGDDRREESESGESDDEETGTGSESEG